MKLLLASVAANVLERALPFFPKPPQDCKLICIPTAAKVEKGPTEWFDNELNEFRRLGFILDMMDIDDMNEANVAARLNDTDIIYVTGGNTFFLLEKMKACNFIIPLRKALDRGAIYIGSSAGTVVCCPDIDYVRDMDDPTVAKLSDTKGLNLIDFFVMVHMDHPGFAAKARAKSEELKTANLPVSCLRDDQALFVDGSSISII